MGRLPAPPATGQPGPTGPLQIVALPPCRTCGLPEGCHQTGEDQDGNVVRFCPERLPAPVASPDEWLPSEGTLLKLLKRHYGWLQPEANVLMRPER